MLKYTIKRLLQSLLTVLIITTAVFLLMRMLPTEYYFTEEELIKLNEAQKSEILLAKGLLDPPLVQLGRFYKNLLLRFDLGTSLRLQAGVPVMEVIGSKFAISMRLGCVALVISLILGVTVGVFQAIFKDRLFDHIGTAYVVFVNAVPHLVTYSLILLVGAMYLKLPSMYSINDPAKTSILPVFCLSLGSTAGYMLWMRRYIVDELNKDYIKLAKVTGMSTRSVMFRHVVKNAFVPMAQFLPQAFLSTVGGSLLVEKFFAVPGMGPLLAEAIGRYDTNLVQALVMLYATLGIIGIFFGDILMMLIDPRIRITGKEGNR